jgi:hypothetical protein
LGINCLLQQVIEVKIKGGIEVTGRRGRIRRKLLDDHKERRKVKVNFTLVQARRLCIGRKAHRGSTDIALLFLDHGNGKG